MNLAALFYLAAPALLFLARFVGPALGAPLALALAAALAHAAWQRRLGASSRLPRVEPATLLGIVLASCVVALMGFAAGHYCWDWIKHWAMLNSLQMLPWPVQVELQGEPGFMRFYVGAYLVPSGLASLTGWHIAACTALWYGLGLAFAFSLVSRCEGDSPGRQVWIGPLLLLMAGADAWLQGLFRAGNQPFTITGMHHEWWLNALSDHPLQYGSPLCLLLWVPHQAVPTFIAVGLLRQVKTARALGPTMLATSMLALWSPYALIGMVVLLGAHVLAQPALRQALLRPGLVTSGTVLVASAFALLMARTLAHELPPGGITLDVLPARLARPGPYLLFLAVELAIPWFVLKRRLFDDTASIAAVATLVVLPWIGGPVPDAVMRISMPALLLLFVRSAHEIAQRPPRRLAVTLGLVLGFSGPTVWGEATFHIEGGSRHIALDASDPLAAPYYTVWARRTTYTLPEFFEICGWKWKPQYFSATPPPSWPRAVSNRPR